MIEIIKIVAVVIALFAIAPFVGILLSMLVALMLIAVPICGLLSAIGFPSCLNADRK